MRRLTAAPRAEDLLAKVAQEAMGAAEDCAIEWEPGKQTMLGCHRASAPIRLFPETFDALMNGRSGYRAQYYLSTEEGAHFNAELVRALIPAMKTFRQPLDIEPANVLRSLEGPWSKIWVYRDFRSVQCCAG